MNHDAQAKPGLPPRRKGCAARLSRPLSRCPYAGWCARASRKHRQTCDNQGMTKTELHQLVDRLPEGAVDGAAIILGEISDGRIDPEQAWYWTRAWQAKEREADDDRAAGRVSRYENDEDFLTALDERTKPVDADT